MSEPKKLIGIQWKNKQLILSYEDGDKAAFPGEFELQCPPNFTRTLSHAQINFISTDPEILRGQEIADKQSRAEEAEKSP